MTKKRLLLSLALFMCVGCGNMTKSNVDYSDDDVFVHATYTVAGRMKSLDYIRSQNYEEFQFTYFFASPPWCVEDFDMTQEQINSKYIYNWEYSDVEEYMYVDGLIDNIHKNENHKILCSFQGEEFIEIATNKERREKFAQMMAQFVEKHNYDGIELDWEHTVQLPEHALFIKDIREALNGLNLDKKLYVTTALHSFQKYTQEQADKLSLYIDWVNIMTYDMGGGTWGNIASHNTPLNAMKDILGCWDVFSPKKLCIGLSSYGFYYKGIIPNEIISQGEKLEKYGRYSSYTELPALLEAGWIEQWDSLAEAPYYFSSDGTEFMTLDSPRSLEAKMEWVFEAGYKGVFWWEFHTDWILPTQADTRGQHLLMDGVTEIINSKFN